MSETRDSGQHSEKPARKREMSRRQFLTYTLGGTGAFLAVTPLVPMIRFAVDPLLQSAGDSDFVRVAPVDEITAEPKKFNFQRVVTDGWYVDEGGDLHRLDQQGRKREHFRPVAGVQTSGLHGGLEHESGFAERILLSVPWRPLYEKWQGSGRCPGTAGRIRSGHPQRVRLPRQTEAEFESLGGVSTAC